MGVSREEAERAARAALRLVETPDRTTEPGEKTQLAAINPIDWTNVADAEPPPRRFLIDQWMPAGCLSSLYGPGGVGKSLLAQQAATCLAVGKDFLGHRVEQVPVMGLFSEDDDEELIRRQWRINQHFGIRNADLADKLLIQGRSGLDNAIATMPGGAPKREALFELTVRIARERQVGLVIIDNRAQMLLVDENDRAQATFAANLCAGIGREANGASTLLLGHVAKAEGSEYSGSTAWDAVTRSRWWLKRADDAEQADGPPELILERPKSNYAQPGAMRLAWAAGVLRPIEPAHMTPADLLELKLRQGAACQVFLDCLDKLTVQGRPVSHSPKATNYAPKIIAAIAGEFTVRELTRAMEILFDEERILANQAIGTRPNRTPITGIAKASAQGFEA